MEKKEHGLTGRPSNRTLPEDEGKRVYLHLRVSQEEKASYDNTARKIRKREKKTGKFGTSEWVREVLNREVQNEETNNPTE